MSSAALKAAATGQATPQEARNPYEGLKRQLEMSKAEFMPLFGQSSANVDRFVRVVLNAVLSNTDLLEADRRSLISACMKAAQDGLMPDGREAVLNIYNSKVSKRGEPDRWAKVAQYLPMVGGLIKKLYESGEVTYIDAACVYENDHFKFTRGEEPKLEHEPTMADAPGKIVAAYVVIKLKNGEVKREVMPRRDIEQVRAASKSKDNGPWVTWYDQQAIKSVIKRAYKQLPKSDAFEKIADADNEALGFAGTPTSVAEITARAGEGRPAQSMDVLENNPGETIDFSTGVNTQEHETVGAEAETKSASGETKAAAKSAPPAKGKTYAQFADAIQKATSADTGALELDEARSVLDAELLTDLGKVYEKKWGNA